jgi:ABC-type glycerol-3-phosphate transport system permease component
MTKENKTKTLKVLKKVGYFILSGFVALIIIGIIATIFDSSSSDKTVVSTPEEKAEVKVDMIKEIKKVENEFQDTIKSNDGLLMTREEYKKIFLRGCVDEGGNKAFCSCAFNYIDDEVGTKRFQDESMLMVTTGMSDEFADVMVNSTFECIDLY